MSPLVMLLLLLLLWFLQHTDVSYSAYSIVSEQRQKVASFINHSDQPVDGSKG